MMKSRPAIERREDDRAHRFVEWVFHDLAGFRVHELDTARGPLFNGGPFALALLVGVFVVITGNVANDAGLTRWPPFIGLYKQKHKID